MAKSIYGSISLILGFFIPKLVLHERIEFSLDLDHDMKLLLLEIEVREELLWVVWEVESILEVNVVKPFFEVVHVETE